MKNDPEMRLGAVRRALKNIKRDAGRAALGDRSSDKPSPAFMVSIGLAEPEAVEHEEDDTEDED